MCKDVGRLLDTDDRSDDTLKEKDKETGELKHKTIIDHCNTNTHHITSSSSSFKNERDIN